MARATREGFRPTPVDRSQTVDLPMDEFPNSVVVDIGGPKESAQVVEIIDDTPAEDRGRPTSVDDLEPVAGDSPNVAKRIARIKAETHTERRGREEAERQREAAIEAARVAREEVADLRRRLDGSTGALAASMKSDREARLADAERRHEQAVIDGDAKAMTLAAKDMSMAQAEIVQINARTPAPRTAPDPAPAQQQQPAAQQRAEMKPNVAAWISKHAGWFNVDQEKTRSAYALSRAILERGVRDDSPEYTREMDRALKALYPDHVVADGDTVSEEPATPRRTNVVADGARETGRVVDPRRVTLTSSELAVAKRLGLTTDAQLAAYARSKQKQGAGA